MDLGLLRQNRLFAQLTEDELAEVARELAWGNFAAGEPVILEGRAADRVYLLLAGEARVLKRAADGQELEIARLGPGELFGQMSAALGAARRSASVVATTPLSACWMERDRFNALLDRNPTLARNALAQVASYLERANARLLERLEGEQEQLENLRRDRAAELARANERVRRELEIAQRVQRNLLPERHRQFPGVSVDTEYTPCEELGGDIMGVFQVDETRVALYGGDVSGHGIYAAVVMSYVKKLVESSVKRVLLKGQYVVKPPGAVLATVNQGFISEISQGDPEIYLTLFLGVLDLRDLTLSYSSAGIHRPPLVLSGGELDELFETSEFPIGHVPEHEYQTRQRRLSPGDLFLFISDGVTEAARKGEHYGVERLKTDLRRLASGPEGLRLPDLGASVSAFLAGEKPQDDMCFMLMRVQAALPPVA